jgi:methyltransferase (TIGR00027 family)
MGTDATPSATARRVAAYRLSFERISTPYGNAAADDALARDVAGDEQVAGHESMTRYLKGRTAFFDRVVVNAIGRGVTQLVSIGAGYDGRALRYAAPGVRWWEVDRAPTQADKRARLTRLGIDAGHINFVPFDLQQPGLAAALMHADYDTEGAGMFLCEGVAVYLDPATLQSLLDETRKLATVGSRLALSAGTSRSSVDHDARRRGFEAVVAGLGEPARNSIDSESLVPLLDAARWRTAELSDRSARAGFVVALPV